MHNTQVHIARFVIFCFYVFFYDFAQRVVAGFVALDDIPDTFIYNDEMIVFKKHLKVGGDGILFIAN